VSAGSFHTGLELGTDVGVDSLMKVEIIAYIEDRTGTVVHDEDAARLRTVQELVELFRASLFDRSLGLTAEKVLDVDGQGAHLWGEALADAAHLTDDDRLLLEAIHGVGQGCVGAEIWRACTLRLFRSLIMVEAAGHGAIPPGPVIYAANHASHLDSFATLDALGERSRSAKVVSALDYWHATPVRHAIASCVLDVLTFDRHGNVLSGLKSALQALQAGRSLLLFPEGTRSMSGALGELKLGLGALAVEAGVLVVPVRIVGAYELLPKGRSWPKRGHIEVRFLDPVDPRSFDGASAGSRYERYRAFVARIRRALEEPSR
jgi:1-acyl-sn-glycerol-3-phosphate acyltransferase